MINTILTYNTENYYIERGTLHFINRIPLERCVSTVVQIRLRTTRSSTDTADIAELWWDTRGKYTATFNILEDCIIKI